MKYRVHVYRVMRLVFDNVEADSMEAASEIAAVKDTDHAREIADCDGQNMMTVVDQLSADGEVIDSCDFDIQEHA